MNPSPPRVPFPPEVDRQEKLRVPVPPSNLRRNWRTGNPDLRRDPFLSAEVWSNDNIMIGVNSR